MNPLKLSAWASALYSAATLAAGATGYFLNGNPVSLGVGVAASAALAAAAGMLAQGRLAGGFLAGGTALILGLFFGYRFIASGSFVPGGVMLLVSFVALFFVLIGMFLSLER